MDTLRAIILSTTEKLGALLHPSEGREVLQMGLGLFPVEFSGKRWKCVFFFNCFFFRFYLFIPRERENEGGRKGEKHQCVVASHAPSTCDLAHNPGMCPDRESNWRPSGSQASAQSTEPHQPG